MTFTKILVVIQLISPNDLQETCAGRSRGGVSTQGNVLTNRKLTVRVKNGAPLWGFPHGSVGKESACNAGDPGLIPGLGRSPGEGKGYPLQYSDLENSMD